MVPVKCTLCYHVRNVNVSRHLEKKIRECPGCTGFAPWTLEKFTAVATVIHDNKYDYSSLEPCDVVNAKLKFPIRCKTCNFVWRTNISTHIHKARGCANCAGNARWTLEKFVAQAGVIHNNRYDYSHLLPDDIFNANVKFCIKCVTCKHLWDTNIMLHIHKKEWMSEMFL